MHHRHHFAHQYHPTTLTASSSTTQSTPSISRFITSTILPTTPTPLVFRSEAPDASENDNDTPDDSDTNASNSSDIDGPEVSVTSEIPTRDEIAQPTMRTSRSSLTPNGIKAGIAGGDAYPFFKDHIGWWYDWTPNPSKPGKPIGVPMLWGGGTADPVDAARLVAFKKIKSPPPYVLAYEEPDCPPGSGSAGMTVSAGVAGWERLIVPLGKKGSLTGSPSMCSMLLYLLRGRTVLIVLILICPEQADETWLAQFSSKISTQWDFTAVHINKNNIDGVKKDIVNFNARFG
ncbi:hypothetical protein C0993_000131 [Termitomyces sp. T159_Od127]|nr:hypothetical protein C0993_000131 [Termitomyces sp. T159_Od127]